ncbi:MAG TPA: hypothetical protein VNW06_05005, partial [Cytophagaceae bacterium]|nr:hypothetical protein [Cytophagaceae bacterium]
IAPNSDNARKGQVKQLKGYLLLFEQIMADYLSQLANSKTLFSLNPETRQTYFYQSLENSVPGIKPLLKKGEYQERLLKLSQMGDADLDRRNRFLDYMLAIHGVVFKQDLLIQFNYYYDKNEYEILLLDAKTKLLQSILSFTKNRARAYNYQKPKSTGNIVGIEEKIYLLLGIVPFSFGKKSNNESYSSINSFNRIGLKLVKIDNWVLENEEEVNNNLSDELYIKKNYCFVDTDDFLIGDYSDVDRDKLLAQLFFFHTGIISEEFLREGLTIEQYNIGEVDGNWNIIFNSLRQKKWMKIGVCASEKEANLSVQFLINFLKNKNIETEQFYILEHILLRPDRNECCYGVFILSPEGKALLRSTRLYTLPEREKAIKELVFSISCYENYTVEITSAGDFEMHFKTFDGEHSFVSITAKESVEEMHSDMEILFQYMSNQFQLISYENKIGLYVRYFQNAEIISEDFFSFRSTIIFPDCTARFNNKEFRAVAESIIIENMPAHVSSTIRWLNFNDMQEYEKVYHLWMEEKLKNIPDKEKLNQLNDFLVNFLLKFDRK